MKPLLPLLLLFAALLAPLPAQEPAAPREAAKDPLLALAESYLERLCTAQYDALAPMLAEDALFEDPTAVTLTGEVRRLEGRDAMLAFFRRTKNRDTQAGYRLVETFVSGEHVVMRLNYVSRGAAAVQGDLEAPPAAGVNVAAVTILRIQEGKIVHHLDHVDYATMLRQARGED